MPRRLVKQADGTWAEYPTPAYKRLEQPEFVETIEECTDRNKAYVLPDGYIYAYGTRHGELYTNIFQKLEGETKGEPYNGVGYKDNVRIDYSDKLGLKEEPFDTYFTTGFIPFTADKTFRARNVPWDRGNEGNCYVLVYKSDKTKLGAPDTRDNIFKIEENGDLTTEDVTFFKTWYQEVAYIRLCVYVGDDPTVTPDFGSMIMTINEPIVEGEVEGFHNTGISYLQKTGGGNVTFDYAAYGLPELALSGDVSKMTKENDVELDYVYGERSGKCTCKWQGSSSIAYPKKNYTIKFDEGFEAFKGYGDQEKYCFKANFIDHSHARNIVCAKLWGDVVRSRKNGNTANIITTLLEEIPNCGAIDGFPCVITINGEYQGLYTFNIPKDGWMFGMGSGSREAIICAENDMEPWATRFESHATIGEHFSLEYALNENDAGWVETSLNRLIDAINTVYANNGAGMDDTLPQYLDLESAIDYYIFTTLVGGLDMTNKNYLLVTYDGTKWFFSAYDMDSTFGLHYDGKSFDCSSWYGWDYYQGVNRLMGLIYTHKKKELKERYEQLRSGALSVSNVVYKYANFVCGIPERIYLSDTEVWPTIPSSSASNLAQITSWYQERARVIDEQVEAWG